MANYPSVVQTQGSSVKPIEDRLLDIMENGDIRFRIKHTTPTYEIILVHEGISTADKDTLVSFYATNLAVANTLVYTGDGLTYTVYFKAPLSISRLGASWVVSVLLVGKVV